jgi:anaerobic magnesium-protoporphyrin IX monomethyl ester cyclase
MIQYKKPRILFVTTPIRPTPTEYPPLAVWSMMNVLRKQGFNDINFYNIGLLRPSIDVAVEYIVELRPDILAVSAVVSTAYRYVKEFTLAVKTAAPETMIIVGGPMGASAEILLSKTGVDLVCMSEGEPVMSDLLPIFEWPIDTKRLEPVKGLAYLDEHGAVTNTGYANTVDKADIYEIDFNDLTDPTTIDHYFPVVTSKDSIFGVDPRVVEKRLLGKKSFELPGSKGCVAKCTFCHRWDKGIRYVPVPVLMNRLARLKLEFDVHCFRMSDENFGTDKKWLKEFCKEIRKLDVLWAVSGMRVNSIDDQSLKLMKDSGCVRCVFGMETGSPRMLKIMNKGVQIEDNYNALKLIYKNGLTTTVQLVVGMPGETNKTIEETASFLRYSVSLSRDTSPFNCSINYAQALPGTPLYEYARYKGMLGEGLDDEEDYLLWISDRNSADDAFTLPHLSGQPALVTLSWRPFLVANAAHEYIQKFGWKAYLRHVRLRLFPTETDSYRTGYFQEPRESRNQRGVSKNPTFFRWVNLVWQHPIMFFPHVFSNSWTANYCFTIIRAVKRLGFKNAFYLIFDYVNWLRVRRKTPSYTYGFNSLRKTMDKLTTKYSNENKTMALLRAGRW